MYGTFFVVVLYLVMALGHAVLQSLLSHCVWQHAQAYLVFMHARRVYREIASSTTSQWEEECLVMVMVKLVVWMD